MAVICSHCGSPDTQAELQHWFCFTCGRHMTAEEVAAAAVRHTPTEEETPTEAE